MLRTALPAPPGVYTRPNVAPLHDRDSAWLYEQHELLQLLATHLGKVITNAQ